MYMPRGTQDSRRVAQIPLLRDSARCIGADGGIVSPYLLAVQVIDSDRGAEQRVGTIHLNGEHHALRGGIAVGIDIIDHRIGSRCNLEVDLRLRAVVGVVPNSKFKRVASWSDIRGEDML